MSQEELTFSQSEEGPDSNKQEIIQSVSSLTDKGRTKRRKGVDGATAGAIFKIAIASRLGSPERWMNSINEFEYFVPSNIFTISFHIVVKKYCNIKDVYTSILLMIMTTSHIQMKVICSTHVGT